MDAVKTIDPLAFRAIISLAPRVNQESSSVQSIELEGRELGGEPSHSPGSQKASMHIHIENPAPLVDGILDRQSTARDASKAKQDIDPSELGRYVSDRFIDLALIRNIYLSKHDHGLAFGATDAPVMLYGEGALLCVYVEDGKMGDSVLEKRAGGYETQALRGTGDSWRSVSEFFSLYDD